MKPRQILFAGVAAALLSTIGRATHPSAHAGNIVLVHGALMDGSSWRAVYDILTARGYRVSVVQQPLTSLADDVAATKRVIDQQPGPVVLVGHSYGGAVISSAGSDPKVKALVYVAAFQPDIGESPADLGASRPAAASANNARMTGRFMYYDRAKYRADIAADVPQAQTDFMAASQVHTVPAVFATKLTVAAWRTRPSHAIVAQDDKTINPELQRTMYRRSGATVTEIKASHSVHISRPRAVADVIARAAREAQ